MARPHRTKPPGDVAERLWSRVDKSGDCWLWTGSVKWTGYGQLRVNRTCAATHRLAYELTYGPIPDGLWVCHTCDVRRCCNPDHLFLGTPQDNVDDMMAKGRYQRDRNYERGSARKNTTLTEAKVAEMVALVKSGVPQRQVAAMFGACTSTVNRIVLGKGWRHVTCSS